VVEHSSSAVMEHSLPPAIAHSPLALVGHSPAVMEHFAIGFWAVAAVRRRIEMRVGKLRDAPPPDRVSPIADMSPARSPLGRGRRNPAATAPCASSPRMASMADSRASVWCLMSLGDIGGRVLRS
jgi:hypothetical protein